MDDLSHNLHGTRVTKLVDMPAWDCTIPPQFGSLVSLQEFRIGGNPYLTGEIPPELGFLSNLITFGVDFLGYLGQSHWSLGCARTSELRNLYLHMNKIKNSSPENPDSRDDGFSYPWTFIPFTKLGFSIDNILDCLKDENVIGKGCSGVVYKAEEMPNGEVIVVKKLWKTKKEEEPAIDSFAAEIQILSQHSASKYRHREGCR
ncbi:hypothetical protein LXL04_029415 [Taraxacum kok-saghyz]